MVSGPRWHRPGRVTNGPDQEHSPRHVLRLVSSEGLRVGHTVHRGRQETRLSRKDCPATHSVPDPSVGNVPKYLATTQVDLYGAGTNGRPVQQRYTLTGSASIGPPKGKLRGRQPEPASGDPPPTPPHRTTPHTHHSPGSPEAGTKGATPKTTELERGGGGERKGTGESNSVVQRVVQHATSGTRDGPPRVNPFTRVHSSHNLR